MQGEENYLGAGHEVTEDDSHSAVNKLILDYYKKFGRKRDLEHYFSLSTAQNDLRDPSGSFWRRMKSQDSSDCSGDKSESSQELCRISIRCSQADPSDSQYEHSKKGGNSESPVKSPPIIVEDPVECVSKNSDDDYGKSDDNQSQKSLDMLDTSTNPRSPTSSITSQRKLEWDSLADVGYANESDRKNSASSLSTLERLALKQQYTNNDAEKSSQLGLPTAHSTPLDENDRSKSKKGLGKKTKIYKNDVDFVEVNVPQNNNGNASQLINVNLTKHISFNVQKDGGVTMDNITTDVNIEKSPDKVSVETEITPQVRIDKEIQTTIKTNDKSVSPDIPKKLIQPRKPVMIRLNTLKKRNRRKKIKNIRKKINAKKKSMVNRNIQDKAGEQLSEAESFEYMPGHVYNQNHMNINQSKSVSAGNKSSLESSGLPTSDSSKGSKYSFKKDLEKSIDILKAALQENYDNNKIKKKLIKDVILRLLNSKYRDDESSTDFLSGLSFKSNRIGLQESNQTTSTSEGNTFDKIKTRPKKSILRTEKFNANDLASTSQSAPNLPIATNNDKPFASNFVKHSNTDTDASSREKLSSNGFAKTSSEQIYQKYLEALKKEETYKRLLRDKEILLKQKLRSSDSAFKVPFQLENKVNNRMSELLKDLTRNNYNDGSGDASKLEGVGGSSNLGFEFNKRCHSVFTLSSGHSDQNKKPNQKKRQQTDVKDLNLNKAGPSKREHYCCCPHHTLNVKGVMDSSVQVNIENKPIIDEKHFCSQKPSTKPGRNVAHFISDVATGEVKYVCLCGDKVPEKIPDNYLIYRCSRLENKGVQSDDVSPETVIRKHDDEIQRDKNVHHIYQACTSGGINKATSSTESSGSDIIPLKRPSKSSQTNLFLKMLRRKSSDHSTVANSLKDISKIKENREKKVVHEAIRCIQTEISIDPKISDPSLTDINIINDMDCFKLVSEQYRVVSSRNSETDTRNQEVQSDVEASTSNENINQTNSKDVIQSEVELLESQSEIENNNKNSVISLTTDTFPENFTIPIQGTNMMLMVSIGNNIQASEPKQVATQGIATENPEKAEESTSLMEECSKAVQNDLIRDKECKSVSIDHNSNRISPKEDINPNFVDSSVKSIKKFSTYPKYMKKNFLRSNTDTDIVQSVSLQNDLVKNNMFQKQYQNLDMQSPKKDVEESSKQINMPESSDRSRPNDCYLNNENCTGSSGYCPSKSEEMPIKYNIPNRYHKSTDTLKTSDDKNMYLEPRSEKNISSKKDVGIQKYMSLERNFEEIDIPKENDDYSNNSNYTVNSKKTENNMNKEYKNVPDNITNNHIETNINVPKASDHLSNYKRSENIKCDINESKRKQSNVINTETKIQEDINTNYCNSVPTSDKDLERNDLNIESSEETLSNTYAQDPILNLIKDITKRYSKTDLEKSKKKKCFKEIVSVLNYLLDTDESSDKQSKNNKCSSQNSERASKIENGVSCQTKILVDKAVQLTGKKKKVIKPTESSDLPTSTDFPGTSTDSTTCKVLNKIKNECEKYQNIKHCKYKKCDASSSSANYDQCKHCICRNHKCKRKHEKSKEKPKKPIAYNLIIQTSESISEETICNDKQSLKNIIVKVPSRYKKLEKEPFKEVVNKIQKKMTETNKSHRSRSVLNDCEMSSSGEIRQANTIREYLEKNRPDFVEKCSQRQNCLKYISESRDDPCNNCGPSNLKMIIVHTPACSNAMANCNMCCGGIPMPCNSCIDTHIQTVHNEVTRLANERAAHRDLLSMFVDGTSPLNVFTLVELRHLAKEIGIDQSNHKQKKIISEREMKKRSEKIYKSLPEVVQKKEDRKKENIKRTNLLMANIFKKNLQKKALRGSVNLSNYSFVIKI